MHIYHDYDSFLKGLDAYNSFSVSKLDSTCPLI